MQRNEVNTTMTTSNDNQYMTVVEACNHLGISRRTLERYAEQGLITRYRRGLRNVVFKREDVLNLERFLNEPKQEEE